MKIVASKPMSNLCGILCCDKHNQNLPNLIDLDTALLSFLIVVLGLGCDYRLFESRPLEECTCRTYYKGHDSKSLYSQAILGWTHEKFSSKPGLTK
jgi:hypothetical protein